jgi:predicted nucleic acid-binding protein
LSAQRLRPVIDTPLAATTVAHELIFVTRYTSDVQDIKVKLLNPWRRGI